MRSEAIIKILMRMDYQAMVEIDTYITSQEEEIRRLREAIFSIRQQCGNILTPPEPY